MAALSKPEANILDRIQQKLKSDLFQNYKIWWALTFFYFNYVVLGGISWKVHRHLYTGHENESVITRLKKGKVATFKENVYSEFFFPSFLRYHNTYRTHVLMAGVWLLSGTYNLRNQPEFAGVVQGVKQWNNSYYHARISGILYMISSILKGFTACQMSLYSHSLGYARYPMTMFGIYDIISCLIAYYYIRMGNVAQHKRWMIRNFSVGAGSIFVRIFGAAWAVFDLEFMRSVEMYRKMNNVILCTGFSAGLIFGEYWVADTRLKRDLWTIAMAGSVVATIAGARQIYKEAAAQDKKA